MRDKKEEMRKIRERLRRWAAMVVMMLLPVAANGAEWEVRDSVLMIPASARSIPAYAFADRDDFHSVRVATGARLGDIGEYAFLGCRNLREVELGSSVVKLGRGAFRECGSLCKAVMPGVKVVPRECFSWCAALEEVKLSPRLADISSQAFSYCGKLEHFSFPSTLTHIGSNAFSFCGSLREANLPASIIELESYAFSECVSLEKAVLPGNGKMLGELIFSGCRQMRQIVEPSGAVPTFDCNSTLFEPGEEWMYERCELLVPERSLGAYRKSEGWKMFGRIRAIEGE